MRPVDTTARPATAPAWPASVPTRPAASPAWSGAELVELTTRLANQLPNAPAPVPTPADVGP
jgi:hypothetical protein